MALALLGTVLWGTALIAVVAILSAIPGLIAVRNRLKGGPANFSFPWRRPRGLLEWTLCAVIVCECLFLFRFAWTTALGWDGLMVWEIKARIAFANGGGLPAEYFTDPTRAWSHPDYPLMLPLLETWIYLWTGQSNESLAQVILPLFYLAAVLLLCSGAAEITGKRWVGWLTAALLFFIPFSSTGQSNLFTGYADFPLAVLYLAAVICLIRYFREGSRSHALLAGIYAGALPWMKHEGTLLWLCVMCVASVELLRRRDMRSALIMALPGMVVIAGWKIAMLWLKAIPGSDFLPVTAANITNNLPRTGTIVHAVIRECLSLNDWSILWWVWPAAMLALAGRGRKGLSLQLAALVLMPLALDGAIYLLSNWHPYQTHIDCSLPRLISQLSIVALLGFGIAVPVAKE